MNIPRIVDAIGYIDDDLITQHWKIRRGKGIIL